MARLLEQQAAPVEGAADEESTGTARTTARALATALALLMISLLVVTRSRDAFDTTPARSEATFTTGDVRLTDDDGGSTLFDIPNMVPGRPVRDCIAVTYEGDVVPVDVRLEASADGVLAPALQLTIEAGTGGGFQACGGFEATDTLFEGTLAELADTDALDAFRATETPATRTFRFTFDLDPDVPVQGRARASADLAWTADT
jgi:hypothetical protein